MRVLSLSTWMSHRLVFALCSLGVAGCLGDSPSTSVNSLQGQGGNAGSAGGDAGSGGGSGEGGAPNTAGDGGSSGSGFGGSGSTAGGSAGSVGSAGSAGSAGAGEPDAGGAISEPDAGEPVDPGEEEPEDEAVLFSDVFPLLVAECGNCHGANAPGARPRFAIANNEAASFAATQLMSQGQLVSERIVVRAVIARTMPTGCNGGALGTGSCLSQQQADLLEQWVADGAQP